MKKSGLFKFGQKTVAITILAQLGVIHIALLLEHLLFDGAQKIAGRLIQQSGFALFGFCSGNFHAFTIR